jgi:hypothetical protein
MIEIMTILLPQIGATDYLKVSDDTKFRYGVFPAESIFIGSLLLFMKTVNLGGIIQSLFKTFRNAVFTFYIGPS